MGGKMIGKNSIRGFARRNYESHFTTAPRCNRRLDLVSMRRCLGESKETSFDTTSREDFSSPVRNVERPREKLVRIDTFKHTKNERPTERPKDSGAMWSIYPKHPPEYGRRSFETTTQSEYDNGLTTKDDPLLPDSWECRGGHEKAKTNFNVFPFGHAKNNFEVTPGARTTFYKDNAITGIKESPKQFEEGKRFGRRYAFTGMARRAGARVFYDEDPPLAQVASESS